MRVLIIHQNFPGQFRHVARAWAQRPGWKVVGLGRETAPGLPDLPWVRYKLHRQPGKGQHPYLRQMEHAVLHGQAVARVLLDLKRKGYKPDVILAHPGWGETLYAKDVFPDVRLVHFCEWYYGRPDADVDFDPEFPASFDAKARIRTWNALHTLNLENCDAAVTPTQWQWLQHPATYRDKIRVAHEGIDLDGLLPDPEAALSLPNGTTVRAGDPVVTYVARNLEPYRGFHVFMRALEKVQRAHPGCQALIVGGDEVSYGARAKDAANWRVKMQAEVQLDPARTHFLGKVPYAAYKKVLQVSAAHVYLTYPFVLSWSALEAMAAGCLMVASDTEPVREFIRHGDNGLLVDFFDSDAVAQAVLQGLEKPHIARPERAAARECARAYGLVAGLDAYTALLGADGPSQPVAEPAVRLAAA